MNFTLSQAESQIRSCLASNESANVDRVDRIILDGQRDRLNSWLALATDPRTPKHYFGENWKGPSLQDVLNTCAEARGRKMEKAA